MVPEADLRGGRARSRASKGARSTRSPRTSSLRLKRDGISDERIAASCRTRPRSKSATRRKELGVAAVFNRVTPAPRSSKASRRISIRATNRNDEAEPTDRKKVMILGSGPNRIGQGIEFDYCCCHASFALQEFGVESIMVNCNPETVSTDYDTSDRLYFEPLTLEEVHEHRRHREAGRRDRAVRRTDAAESGAAAEARSACRSSAPIRRTSIWRKIASSSASCSTICRFRRRRTARRRASEEAVDVARRLGYPGAGAAQLRARRPRDGDRLRRRHGAPVHARSGDVLAGRGRC